MPDAVDAAPASPSPRVRAWQRRLVKALLRSMGSPPLDVALWDGSAVSGRPGAPAEARVRMRDPSVLRDLLLRGPDPALGDAYVEGRVEIEGDVARTLECAFQPTVHGGGVWGRVARRLHALQRSPNSLRRSRQNVHHHYDLGNEFYRLWLDEEMVYTCAYFARPGAGLEEAQRAKLEHVARKLELRPGDRVVEAGCGWGALALHLAEHHGVTVRAFNVSTEQIRYAREQARRRGLETRVEFVEDDYRSVRGPFDAFVSVGMLEHVGRSHYRDLGRAIDRTLVPDGRGLLHFIGRARPQVMSPWLVKHIFPGSHIPSLREMLPVLEPFDLAVTDVENLRWHYARTLEHWLERFEKAEGRVRALYDERFVRTWRLYLASSLAAFRTGSVQLFQVAFRRAGGADWPWTREALYRREPALPDPATAATAGG